MSKNFPYVYALHPNVLTFLFSNYPLWQLDFSQGPQSKQQHIHQPENQIDLFLIKFQQYLKNNSSKYIKKVWTKQQDKLLLNLRNQNLRWTEISEKISQSNPQICKRRLQRLKIQQNKWPCQFQQEIKKVCAMKQIKWNEKIKILHQKFPQSRNYSKKKIKQRYLTYLDQQIEHKSWTPEQDLNLIRLIRGNPRKWKKIAQYFPGRTQLHVKNRYYGCLRKIQSIVENQMLKK